MTTFDMDTLGRVFIGRSREPAKGHCSTHWINDIGGLPGGFNL